VQEYRRWNGEAVSRVGARLALERDSASGEASRRLNQLDLDSEHSEPQPLTEFMSPNITIDDSRRVLRDKAHGGIAEAKPVAA
jgi:hypothetical protein